MYYASDRGSQYASADYQHALKDRGVVCSMSRKGDCWDNALAESFFATLRKELTDRVVFLTRDAARTAVFEFIEAFYNRIRRRSTLGMLSPIEFENTTRRSEDLASPLRGSHPPTEIINIY